MIELMVFLHGDAPFRETVSRALKEYGYQSVAWDRKKGHAHLFVVQHSDEATGPLLDDIESKCPTTPVMLLWGRDPDWRERTRLWLRHGVIHCDRLRDGLKEAIHFLTERASRITRENAGATHVAPIGGQVPLKPDEDPSMVSLFFGPMKDFVLQLKASIGALHDRLGQASPFDEKVSITHWLNGAYFSSVEPSSEEARAAFARALKAFREMGNFKRYTEDKALSEVVRGQFWEKMTRPEGWRPPDAILLEGESGTGKTLVARLIRDRVARMLDRPEVATPAFSQVNCSAFTDELFLVEFFGSILGAYTGSQTSPGKALKAYGGIVFLDEIGDLSPANQARLLTFLDNGQFHPQGWHIPEPLWSPVLVIGATNKNLARLARRGKFRRDLFARFKRRLRLPAIRERMADFDLLVDTALQGDTANPPLTPGLKAAGVEDRSVTHIDQQALRRLKQEAFEGTNFRGLENRLAAAVEHARRCGSRILMAEDITRE